MAVSTESRQWMQRLARIRAQAARLRGAAGTSGPALDLVVEMLELTDTLRGECAALQQRCSALAGQLAEKDAAADAVLDAMPVPILATDASGTILEANRAAAALLGRSAPRLRNELLLHFCLDREGFSQLLDHLPEGDGQRQITLTMKPRDRKAFTAHVAIAPDVRTGRARWLWFLSPR